MSPWSSTNLTLAVGALVAYGLLCFWAALSLLSLPFDGHIVVVNSTQLATAVGATVRTPFATRGIEPTTAPAALAVGLTVLLAAAPLAALRRPGALHHVQRIVDELRGRPTRGARWARASDMAPLVTAAPTPGRLMLGTADGRRLATEERHSVIVFGPTGSYKTSGLAIPAIREWDGPVLCASVKTDLLQHTIEQRQARGDVMVFDPTESAGMLSDGWSPLGQCASWHGALRVAQWLCTATHTGGSGGDLDFWYRAAKKLLAPILFAAASSGRSMADVVRWVDHQNTDEVDAALQAASCEEATDAWVARELRDPKQRASIYTTLETVLDAYQDPRVLRDSERAGITRDRLLGGGRHSLYICAPADDQEALRSVFATLVVSVTSAVYEQVAATRKPLDPPLLLVLDELANVAPIPRLDVLASTGRDQGIQQLSILQDLSQLEERYGPRRARTIVNNHHAKLVLSGQSDQATLDLVGQLLGDEEIPQSSRSTAEGRTTHTESTQFRRLASSNTAREQERGRGILIYGHLPPARVHLTPWFE